LSEQDQQAPFSVQDLEALQTALAIFFEERCSSHCLDNDEDREAVADKLAHWLLSDKVQDVSPEKMLPRARYKLGFDVVDETTNERIIQLLLQRDKMMTDGDFLQMQNFFWVTVGRAIRDNPEIIRTLQAGGIDVNTDPGEGGTGGQQFAS